jgi:hypothetical protein
MYAWHANADADAEYEVQFVSDAFMAGFAGLWNDIQIVADGPVTITSPSGVTTTTNEFIWPTLQIGPSPVAGKRRAYVAMRNSVTNTAGPSENLYIAYADFNGDDIENGVSLQWSHTSIPEMNQWNVDATWRRPFHALTTDEAGNLYYAGYHFATEADGTTDIMKKISTSSSAPTMAKAPGPGWITGVIWPAGILPKLLAAPWAITPIQTTEISPTPTTSLPSSWPTAPTSTPPPTSKAAFTSLACGPFQPLTAITIPPCSL